MQIKRGKGELIYFYTTGNGPREQAYTARMLVDQIVVGHQWMGKYSDPLRPTSHVDFLTRPTQAILALPDRGNCRRYTWPCPPTVARLRLISGRRYTKQWGAEMEGLSQRENGLH